MHCGGDATRDLSGRDRRVLPARRLSGVSAVELLAVSGVGRGKSQRAVANSKEFHDVSPRQFVPTLADRNLYYASESAFYRLLRKHGLLHHRARSRPPTTRPRALTATGPDQVYSWDITYLRSRVRGVYFYLYLVVDIWSRRVVGSSTCSGSTHRSRRRASVCQAPAGPVRSTTASTACTSSTGTSPPPCRR